MLGSSTSLKSPYHHAERAKYSSIPLHLKNPRPLNLPLSFLQSNHIKCLLSSYICPKKWEILANLLSSFFAVGIRNISESLLKSSQNRTLFIVCGNSGKRSSSNNGYSCMPIVFLLLCKVKAIANSVQTNSQLFDYQFIKYFIDFAMF